MQAITDIVQAARTITIHARRTLHGRAIGPYPKAWSGGGFEFRQLRGYTPGDDIRFVDWKSSARTGELLVRDYYDEQNRTFVIVLDCSASMQFSSVSQTKGEIAGNIAATLAYALHMHGDAVGYIAAGGNELQSLPPRSSAYHIRMLMQHIARDSGDPCGQASVSAVCQRLMHMYPQPTGVIYISDFLDDTYEQAIKKMAYQHGCMPIRVLDPQEEQLRVPSETHVYDPETGDHMVVTPHVQAAYTEWFSYYNAYFHNAMRRAGVMPCTCYTNHNWLNRIRTYMHG